MRWTRAATIAAACLAARLAVADVGAGACGSPSCHGGPTARADSVVARQDEYVVWRTRDRHAQAGTVLDDERSQRIAALLELDGPAATAPRCLACHAPAAVAAPAMRADGVSCETCHGAAEGWIARHTERGWSHAASVQRGLVDLRTPSVAAERCLDCHLGRGAQIVDHDLLAAGHPLLRFDLDTYASALPAHWSAHAGNAAWFDGRSWIAGQAAVLARTAQRLGHVGTTGWPDFALYECAACHHEINRDPEWPLAGAGEHPVLDAWFAVGATALVERLAVAQVPALRDGVARLALASVHGFGGDDTRPAVESLTRVAQVLQTIARRPLASADLRAVAARLVVDAPGGFRSAQQVAWGLDAIAVATGDGGRRDAIGRLFPPLRSVGAYDPSRFATALAGVRTAR